MNNNIKKLKQMMSCSMEHILGVKCNTLQCDVVLIKAVDLKTSIHRFDGNITY